MHAIDPQLQKGLTGMPELDRRRPVESRAFLAERLAGLPPGDWPDVAVSDHQVAGHDGFKVPLRVYRPLGAEGPAATVIWMHPGGFTLGSIAQDHERICDMASRSQRQFVSVGYRLAPEDPYPAAVEDCYAVLRAITDRCNDFGVDPDRIGVAGESAGGNLAAAMSLLARDRGGPGIAHQYLFGPVLDDRLMTHSAVKYTDTPIWHRSNAEISWQQYLGNHEEHDVVPTYAAPARATDLAGLPPAYITVSQFDPLRDEGIAYAVSLANANVPVELHMFAGTFHGSVLLREADASQRATAEAIDVFRRTLA